jgi:hypothetical protein
MTRQQQLERRYRIARTRFYQRLADLEDIVEWKRELEWRIQREWERLDLGRGQMSQFMALVEDVHEFSRTCEAIANKRGRKK